MTATSAPTSAPTSATATASNGPIPITAVTFGAETEALVLEVLRSGQVAQGPKVAEFERRFAELHQVRHAVAVNNGTSALVAAFEALDLRPGDEVITSPFTFVATVNAAIEAGASVKFADIGDDFCIDPKAVEMLIGPRTRAIVPVHLFGQPADMASIADLAIAYNLAIVEDAAQAHGAAVAGRPIGAWGQACFSFYATKNISTGEGGMVTTDDDALADRLRLLRNQGMRVRYQYELPGHNWRMTDLQAALALPQLDVFDETIAARQSNAAALNAGLSGLNGLALPSAVEGRRHVWHQYTIRVRADAPVARDELIEHLGQHGVGCGIYYPKAAWDYDCYRRHPKVRTCDTPNAVEAAQEVLSLPVHHHLTANDLDRIIAAVRAAWPR